jgi:hypothetical protein
MIRDAKFGAIASSNGSRVGFNGFTLESRDVKVVDRSARRNRRIALVSVFGAEGTGLVVEFVGVKGNDVALVW